MSQEELPLPIAALEEEILARLPQEPLAVTAPTGTGKSTQVPRWCARLGKVLVVEPRRVACRGLAARVAELEGRPLGTRVGYSVRDEHRAGRETRILFATPGVALRLHARDGLEEFDLVILDEFHERRWDTDLLLALLERSRRRGLVVMSATLEGERVARYLGGTHLHAGGRSYPVKKIYLPGGNILPERRGLEERVRAALGRVAGEEGDVLVFLPGKGEISGLAAILRKEHPGLEILEMHGGLTLEAQARIFRPGRRRRVILATNVAETSITVPRITTVIDSGLARQTRYHYGRSYLTLVPIAADSAEQRAGRAGRLAPGTCLRLWSEKARLAPVTPPEIHRESLAGLFLAAAACGVDPRELNFLDPPREYALEDAMEELRTLGALDGEARITERGKTLFGMPLDPPLGNLILEAEKRGCLEDGVDLAAVLSTGRPLFRGGAPEAIRRLLPEGGCDAAASILGLRKEKEARESLDPPALQEARAARRRLRKAWGLPAGSDRGEKIDRKNLLLAGLAADPRSAWVARPRRGRIHWAREGTEADLARESTLDERKVQALVAWETRAVGEGRKKRILLTQASPVPLSLLAEAGLGEVRQARAYLKEGRLLALFQRILAGRILEEWEEEPRGPDCREALAALFLQGKIFPRVLEEVRDRLEARALLAQVVRAGLLPGVPGEEAPEAPPPLEEWVARRLEELGVEGGEDLELLSPEDLLPPEIPPGLRSRLDAAFPRLLKPGGAKYKVLYDIPGREATLVPVEGNPKSPPPLALLPAFRGFRVKVKHHSRTWVLKEPRGR